MLTEANNRLLTKTGRGTPLGSLMREYWLPVMRSSQLEPGAPPKQLKILGEKLVAFRSPEGEVGIMDEACPHRGASMFLARSEKCGLRCIYHGWKISPAGELLEAPTHPESAPLQKIKTRSHPVREGQGIIWTWLGEGEVPAFRKMAFTDLPDSHVAAVSIVLNCGWLQPLETLWDIFHTQILHNDTVRASFRGDVYFSNAQRSTDTGLKFDYPEMLVNRTDHGFTHINRDAAKDTHAAFIMPFFQHHAISPDPLEDKGVHISVPIDDTHTLVWEVFYNKNAPLKRDGFAMKSISGLADHDDLYNNVQGRGPRTPENRWGWGQDRDAMASGGSFAGFHGNGTFLNTMVEDFCVLESQYGVDRTNEVLAPVDRALVEGRQTVLDAIKAYQDGGPPLARDMDVSNVEASFEVKKQTAD